MNLGDVSLRQNQFRQAISYLRQALTSFRGTGYKLGEIETLTMLAEALHGAAQPAAARAELQTALRLASETGNTYKQASVHRELAESHHRAGEDEKSRHHWQHALAIYSQLGVPEADHAHSMVTAQQAKHAEPLPTPPE
jgi:tetratricopeptide (TPR) repeat protein